MKTRYWALVGLIIAIVVIGAISAYFYNKPDLQLGLDPVVDNQVVVDRVYLDRPGYIVVQGITDGNSSQVVGFSPLIEGEERNMTVPIITNVTGDVTVTLQYDNGDKVFVPQEDTDVVELPDGRTSFTFNSTGTF